MDTNITVQMLQRLPQYLHYLKTLPKRSYQNISATTIADVFKINDVVVRKDLSAVSSGGKPKVGYAVESLIQDIESVLGYNDVTDAVIVGIGNLGHALLSYEGFTDYGLNIIAGFDSDVNLIDTEINGKKILDVNKIENICSRMKIHLGIIAVPAAQAQVVCDSLVRSGVLAILNLAPTHLAVPEGILVQNENMATSLAMLARHLKERNY